MSFYDFPPLSWLITIADTAITTLNELLAPLAGADSAALAVVLLTVGVRTLLIPVARSQLKAGRVRQKLAPELAELRRRHGDDPAQLNRSTMELYAAEGASPLGGCLPVLAQAPVLMAVYGLFVLPTIGGAPNQLLDHTWLGVPLDSALFGQLTTGALTPIAAVIHLVIIVLIAAVALVSRRLLPQPELAPQASGGPDLTRMSAVLGLLPLMTAVIAAVVPLAAALYLATTTVWTLGERLVLNRLLRD